MIFMTSYHDDRTRAAVLDGGALAFLGKPVNLTKLIECLELALALPKRTESEFTPRT